MVLMMLLVEGVMATVVVMAIPTMGVGKSRWRWVVMLVMAAVSAVDACLPKLFAGVIFHLCRLGHLLAPSLHTMYPVGLTTGSQ